MASRLWQERLATALLWASGFLVIGLTGALFTALFVRALPILHRQPLSSLLTGEQWQPAKGIFGFAPFLAGSLWVTLTASPSFSCSTHPLQKCSDKPTPLLLSCSFWCFWSVS